MLTPLERLCSNDPPITQTDLDKDLNLNRVHRAIVHMRRNMYNPIKYHGKMRASDVLAVEELRQKRRKRLDDESSPVESVSMTQLQLTN